MFRVLVAGTVCIYMAGFLFCPIGNSGGGVKLSNSLMRQFNVGRFGTEIVVEYPVDVYNDRLNEVLGDISHFGLFDTIDPEYVEILVEIDRKHSLYKLTHRDLQWKSVAEVMHSLDNDSRVELIKNVRRYPLHTRLPATVAISPDDLNNWQAAKDTFLERVKDVE